MPSHSKRNAFAAVVISPIQARRTRQRTEAGARGQLMLADPSPVNASRPFKDGSPLSSLNTGRALKKPSGESAPAAVGDTKPAQYTWIHESGQAEPKPPRRTGKIVKGPKGRHVLTEKAINRPAPTSYSSGDPRCCTSGPGKLTDQSHDRPAARRVGYPSVCIDPESAMYAPEARQHGLPVRAAAPRPSRYRIPPPITIPSAKRFEDPSLWTSSQPISGGSTAPSSLQVTPQTSCYPFIQPPPLMSQEPLPYHAPPPMAPYMGYKARFASDSDSMSPRSAGCGEDGASFYWNGAPGLKGLAPAAVVNERRSSRDDTTGREIKLPGLLDIGLDRMTLAEPLELHGLGLDMGQPTREIDQQALWDFVPRKPTLDVLIDHRPSPPAPPVIARGLGLGLMGDS